MTGQLAFGHQGLPVIWEHKTHRSFQGLLHTLLASQDMTNPDGIDGVRSAVGLNEALASVQNSEWLAGLALHGISRKMPHGMAKEGLKLCLWWADRRKAFPPTESGDIARQASLDQCSGHRCPRWPRREGG